MDCDVIVKPIYEVATTTTPINAIATAAAQSTTNEAAHMAANETAYMATIVVMVATLTANKATTTAATTTAHKATIVRSAENQPAAIQHSRIPTTTNYGHNQPTAADPTATNYAAYHVVMRATNGKQESPAACNQASFIWRQSDHYRNLQHIASTFLALLNKHAETWPNHSL